jgi:magnesium transporter
MTGILDAYLASVSNRLADVSRLLAVIATLFGPLTVLTGLFGMNVPLPTLGLPGTGAFWEIIGFMAISCALMYWWFKRSGWL